MAGRPLDMLAASPGDSVVVELKVGARCRGVLRGYDQHLNVVLEPAAAAAGHGDTVDNTIVIRGDTVVTIQP